MIHFIKADSNVSVSEQGGDYVVTLDGFDGKRHRLHLPAAAYLDLLNTMREREDDAQDAVASTGYAAQDVEL